MPLLSGTLKVKGRAAPDRTVRIYNRTTGAFIAGTTSGPGGGFVVNSGSIPYDDVLIVAVPTEQAGEEESFNALAVDGFPVEPIFRITEAGDRRLTEALDSRVI